ncbi:MAG: copper transporter, partial [Ornithinimicrobium sp.]
MIDFKYHMVSLVAVFLALAVGIVLGAGPLRGELSDTLESQVAELGQERNDLRARVDLQQQRAEQKDELLDALVPSAVEGTLLGQRVRVVELPGSEAEVADAMATALVQAGAETVTRTVVLDVWDDPRGEAERQAAADEWVAQFPDEAVAEQAAPAELLAVALAGPASVEASESWRVALASVTDLDAIATTEPDEGLDPPLPGGSTSLRQDVVVVLTGGIEAGDLGDSPGAQLLVEQRLALVSALTREDVPTLLIGTGTESFESEPIDAEDPLIVTIRTDGDVSDLVSTVDNTESSAGQLAAIWAAAWLLAGESGDYGLGADAQAPASDPPPS